MIGGRQGYDRVDDIVQYHQSEPIQKIIDECVQNFTYHYQQHENYRYNDTLLQRMWLQEKTLYL